MLDTARTRPPELASQLDRRVIFLTVAARQLHHVSDSPNEFTGKAHWLPTSTLLSGVHTIGMNLYPCIHAEVVDSTLDFLTGIGVNLELVRVAGFDHDFAERREPRAGRHHVFGDAHDAFRVRLCWLFLVSLGS